MKAAPAVAAPMLEGDPAVRVWRGATVESVHRAVVVVADGSGRFVARLGNPGLVTYLRSSAKPFQAVPLVASGAADAFGLTDPELAVIAGSHGGEDRHVKAVESILAKAGLAPDALQCGVHKPYHGPTAARVGDRATTLHHNCSGKHAGMLLLAAHLGAPTKAYIDPRSPGQRAIRRALADIAGLKAAHVRVGTDGCSAPNFAMPVKSAAVAFARLAAPSRAPAKHRDALGRVRDAMIAHPGMVAGEGRFDTDLMGTLGGAALSKSGAEGFEGVGLPSRGLGMAVKIVDGGQRAVPPVVVEALRQLRVARAAHVKALQPHLGATLTNWRGLAVGRLEADFRLRRR